MPIIWRDRQWDYNFLLTIMIHKLELMQEFFDSDNTHSADAKLYATQIRRASGMLDYINNGEYEVSAMQPYYDKYPIDYDNFIMQLNKEKTDEQIALFHKCIDDIEVKYNIAMDEFCKIFKNRLLNWWD